MYSYVFPHIMWPSVFNDIHKQIYIYILLPMYANRFQKINREFGIQTINIYPAGLTHPTKGSRWRCRQCVWHRESLEEPLGAYDWATNHWCSNRFKQQKKTAWLLNDFCGLGSRWINVLCLFHFIGFHFLFAPVTCWAKVWRTKREKRTEKVQRRTRTKLLRRMSSWIMMRWMKPWWMMMKMWNIWMMMSFGRIMTGMRKRRRKKCTAPLPRAARFQTFWCHVIHSMQWVWNVQCVCVLILTRLDAKS